MDFSASSKRVWLCAEIVRVFEALLAVEEDLFAWIAEVSDSFTLRIFLRVQEIQGLHAECDFLLKTLAQRIQEAGIVDVKS